MKTNKTLFRMLLTPFYWIAGAKSLVLGLIVMGLTAFICSLNGMSFDGALDAHITGLRGNLPMHIYFQLSTWIIFSILFMLTIKIFSNTKFRLIDILGTVAMSQIPLILVALWGFTPMAKVLTLDPENVTNMIQVLRENMLTLIINSLAMLLPLIWSLFLKYNAFSVCGNTKGAKAVLIFIGILILAEITSKVLNSIVLPFILS